jgi:hypothetical protein
MQAYVDGKTIEISDKHKQIWRITIDPGWEWITCEYRIEQEPREYWISREEKPQLSNCKPTFHPELWIHVREVMP